MRLVRIDEKLTTKTSVLRLYHLTDVHVGDPYFDEEAFVERRALIEQDPLARFTLGGDHGSLIRHNDPRYEPSAIHPRYRQATDIRLAAREHILELIDPIKEKCWAVADGNHERSMDKYYGGHFTAEWATLLGIESRYVGYRGFVKVTATGANNTTRLSQLIDLQHGWQVGRLKGAALVQAEREVGMTEADIVLRGHNHQPAAHTFRTLGVTSGGANARIVTRPRTLVNGGSWCHAWKQLEPVNRNKLSEIEKDQWAESKGFRAESVGGPVLILSFDQGTAARAAGVEHTIVEGHITAERLGL